MDFKINKYLFLLVSFLAFVGFSFSQNTFDFELTYIDVTGEITGIPGENVNIPVTATFYQEEGRCEGDFGPCSAFLIDSQDDAIDVDFTIREVQNVQFDAFGGGNLNNDFSGNGTIGFEDYLLIMEYGH